MYIQQLFMHHDIYDNHTLYNGGQGRGRDRRCQRRGERFGGRGEYNQTDTSTIELQYAQNNTIVPGSDGRTIDRINYLKCLKHVHCAVFCPKMITGE